MGGVWEISPFFPHFRPHIISEGCHSSREIYISEGVTVTAFHCTGLDHCPRIPLSCFRARISIPEVAPLVTAKLVEVLLLDALLRPPPRLLGGGVGVHVGGQGEVASKVAAKVPHLHVEEREGDYPVVEMCFFRQMKDSEYSFQLGSFSHQNYSLGRQVE